MIKIPGYAKPPSYFARNISLTPAGNIEATNVQDAAEELDNDLFGGLASKQADVMTTKGDLAAYGTAVARLGVGTDGQILTADSGETLGVKWADAAGGLTLVTTESFSAVSSVSLDGCFTSDFANYRVVFTGTHSGGADCTVRLRASGSDNTTTSYKWRQNVWNTASTGNTFIVNNTDDKWRVSYVQTSDSVWCHDIFRPQQAAQTHFDGFGVGAGNDLAHFLGRFDAATQFDGFTFLAPSGTLTGILKVYGYADA